MSFGKHLQKRQLDIPEYAASFVNYKALKKLIKKLSATPIIHAQHASSIPPREGTTDSQTALQANRATFFFRVERELDKVNAFYLQKEAELKLRLKALLDKKKLTQARSHTSSRLSTTFMALEEGFQQFGLDLNKLQQFVEVNATAFSKILKKWDKVSKSRTKELYLSRAVEVQPCFNRDVISELSDQATTSLLDLGAWAEGEKVQLDGTGADYVLVGQPAGTDEDETASQLLEAATSNNIALLQDWILRLKGLPNAGAQVNRIFLAAIAEAPDEALKALLDTGLVNVQAEDEINERNCLHEAAIFGRLPVLQAGLAGGVDVSRVDVYGRIPLHYACMHGRIDMVEALVQAGPNTVNFMDHDHFTPLIHATVHGQLACVQKLLSYHVRINPSSESDHIPLNLASQHGYTEIVRLLLESSAQILCDAEGLFPQHLVARSGREPQLLLMLRDFGADLNEVDRLNQWTPLFHAASEGHVDCMRTLLENGAKVEILDEKDLSALYYAAWEGHLECMKLLAATGGVVSGIGKSGGGGDTSMSTSMPPPPHPSSSTQLSIHDEVSADGDGIPDLSLPPPFIPLRRYGHNFLDSKTFIQITFDGEGDGADAVVFFNGGRYPAARLTISSKSSELIPRNILLPIQEDTRTISFQIDHLDQFAIDFEVFPSFGAKVIAKTAALSSIFNQSHQGHCCLPLFDPRLRAIGQIAFRFQVIQPFQGTALEITDFATYWKATTPFDSNPTTLVTDSSLCGEYRRVYVQLTKDWVPVLYPHRRVRYGAVKMGINQLTYEEFKMIGGLISDQTQEERRGEGEGERGTMKDMLDDPDRLLISLKEMLEILPSNIHVDLHVLYPTSEGDMLAGGGGMIGTGAAGMMTGGGVDTTDLNRFADAILRDVFDHSRRLRKTSPDFMRSIVFSSESSDFCTALNWKQPNYPVFLCNNLGKELNPTHTHPQTTHEKDNNNNEDGEDRNILSMSIKEAVKIAQSNNLMGLICRSELLGQEILRREREKEKKGENN
ncbi:MAG: phosphate system positive regulatory protein pho81 [Watsoniomyces obsoletus]|nr:MAG: phosphate system positive regulatory protein pho81 [Watsoniomyces obsoletus]